MAIAATNDTDVNIAVYEAAEQRAMLVNVVDVPSLCNFILPAIVRTGPLAIAISTAGASPALAKRMKREISDLFGEQLRRARRDPQRGARLGEGDAAHLPGPQGLLRGDRQRRSRPDRAAPRRPPRRARRADRRRPRPPRRAGRRRRLPPSLPAGALPPTVVASAYRSVPRADRSRSHLKVSCKSLTSRVTSLLLELAAAARRGDSSEWSRAGRCAPRATGQHAYGAGSPAGRLHRRQPGVLRLGPRRSRRRG